ncbi:MAG: hypothetical protein WCP35_10585 [Verrucomicrobiota bacterium]
MEPKQSTGSQWLARHLAVWLLSLATLMLASCSKPFKLQVVLDRGEAVEKGMPVFVDAAEVGKVTAVSNEGSERVAELTIADKEVRARLCVGVLRVVESGRIQIQTDTVKPGAVPLPSGARVPTASKIEYLVTQYNTKSTLMAVAVGVAVLFILWLIFRSLVGAVGMILCVVLASILTQVIHPYAVPWVVRAMAQLPPPPVAQAVDVPGKPVADAPSNTTPPPATSGVVKMAQDTVTEVINTHPSPVVVTWCSVFLALFIALNLVLGRVSRVWRK